MSNCPIQLVMNSSDYIDDEHRVNRRGNHKDYYAGKDEEFRQHKEFFSERLGLLASAQQSNRFSQIAYAKVVLNAKAHAKSNRPTEKIFTAKNGCKVVGGNKAGEMYVRFSPCTVGKIKAGLVNAEEATNWVPDDRGEPKAKPTVWRSEVGAIDDVVLLSRQDKCSIVAEEIVEYIKQYKVGYLYVELFETESTSDIMKTLENVQEATKLFSSLIEGLKTFSGLKAYKSRLSTSKCLVVALTCVNETVVDLENDIVTSGDIIDSISINPFDYEQLLAFLTEHPLVKKVSISPVVENVPSPSFAFDGTQEADIPEPGIIDNYSIVGIADTGVSSIFDKWVAARVDYMHPKYKDPGHGTFIAGLHVMGNTLNPTFCKEAVSSRIVEICVLPKEGCFGDVYRLRGFEEFLFMLNNAIAEAVQLTGVRIIGLSMNIPQPRLCDDYSLFAKELDSIAMEHDVILVISAGNLQVKHQDWLLNDPEANIVEYTSRNDDVVYAPGESIRNITVGALNPPDNLGITTYSCIGDGHISATKPDLVHIGGFGYWQTGIGTGVYSVSTEGKIISEAGTSFSAPLVAKTMAEVDHHIEGLTPRETLMALVMHNSFIPESLKDKKYRPYLKKLIGFGMPVTSEQILNGSENSISMVFHNAIRRGQVLSFPFSWPSSLVENEKCKGRVKVTMVCTPQLDYDYGEELVREELQVSLCQVDAFGNRKSRIQPIYAVKGTPTSEVGLNEEERIDSLFKWQPVKIYEKEFSRGVALASGSWRMEVRYLNRENTIPLLEGLKFTIILTIEDPKGIAPVYNEMRLSLQAEGVQIRDLQTSVRVEQRL